MEAIDDPARTYRTGALELSIPLTEIRNRRSDCIGFRIYPIELVPSDRSLTGNVGFGTETIIVGHNVRPQRYMPNGAFYAGFRGTIIAAVNRTSYILEY